MKIEFIMIMTKRKKSLTSKHYLTPVDVKNSPLLLKKYNLNEIKEKCSDFHFKKILRSPLRFVHKRPLRLVTQNL